MSVSVITAGSGIYKKIAEDMDENYQTRVSLAYITEKIRQNDSEGSVNIQRLNDTDCLVLEDSERQFFTCIYYSEGYIYESLIDNPEDFDPYMGEQVLKAGALELSTSGDGIIVKVKDNSDNSEDIFITLRSQN